MWRKLWNSKIKLENFFSIKIFKEVKDIKLIKEINIVKNLLFELI